MLSVLKNSQDLRRNKSDKSDEDVREKDHDDPMAMDDEIEDVPELKVISTKEKAVLKSSNKRKTVDSEEFGSDDIEEDSASKSDEVDMPKRKKRRTDEDLKSLDDLLTDAELKGSKSGPIDLVNSSSSDFQSNERKKRKTQKTLDHYRVKGGKAKIEEDDEEDEDKVEDEEGEGQGGRKKGRKGRKRKRFDEYSDQEDEV